MFKACWFVEQGVNEQTFVESFLRVVYSFKVDFNCFKFRLVTLNLPRNFDVIKGVSDGFELKGVFLSRPDQLRPFK